MDEIYITGSASKFSNLPKQLTQSLQNPKKIGVAVYAGPDSVKSITNYLQRSVLQQAFPKGMVWITYLGGQAEVIGVAYSRGHESTFRPLFDLLNSEPVIYDSHDMGDKSKSFYWDVDLHAAAMLLPNIKDLRGIETEDIARMVVDLSTEIARARGEKK